MTPKERKSLRDRAGKAKKKLDAGKDISAKDRAVIEQWDALPKLRGKSAKNAKAPATPEKKPTPRGSAVTESIAPKSSEPAEPTAPKPLPTTPIVDSLRPPPAPPPRILGAGLGGGDWRDKYQAGSNDREALCVQGATVWCNLLRGMVADIQAADQKSFFSVEDVNKVIYPAAVLTVDKLMPDDFTMSPEITLAFGSSAIIGQRFMAGRSIAKKKAETEAKTNTNLRVVQGRDPKVVKAEEQIDAAKRAKKEAKTEAEVVKAEEQYAENLRTVRRDGPVINNYRVKEDDVL